MIKLGLTGSIGMGKTTTAQMFRDQGCPVFDADAAVHALYAQGGEAVPLIKAVFPDAVRNGAIDRQVLGAHMREDRFNLQVLESFIHPMVGAARAKFIKQAEDDKADIIVFDVPLLFETGGDQYVDFIVVVSAPYKVQHERVMARPGMSEALFRSLLARQMPDKDKRKRADFIVQTDKGLEDARKQVQSILIKIRQKME